MIIRELTHEELLIAVELNYNCWNDDFAGIIPYDSMKIEKELTFVSNWINDKRCQDIRRIYGAFDGDKFLGYVGGSLVVFAPKYIRKIIYGKIKVDIRTILRKLCEHKGVEIIV